jgi:hypothetical protein
MEKKRAQDPKREAKTLTKMIEKRRTFPTREMENPREKGEKLEKETITDTTMA